jgi:hypothetical protein
MENLLKVNERLYLYHLGHSKTDQLGAEQNSHAEKPVADKAADALTAWLEASKAMTGHRSIQTVMRYFQTGAIGQTRAARLLGDDPPSDRGTPDSAGL